jgi:DNA (cytosine-5)-methyltransferase 1
MNYDKYRLIDLFSGCGGMTLGFVNTDEFHSVFANDFNADAMASYKANFDPDGKHTFYGDIIELLDNELYPIPKADVVIGGPPCQGFSLLNRNRHAEDPRRRLWVQFLRVVELSQAPVVVMENVPQLLSSLEYEEICMALSALNFKYIESDTLIAANYGVPEVRKRAIIMASKSGPISLPRPTNMNPKRVKLEADFFSDRTLEPWTTVKSAIGDLPPPAGTEIRDELPPLNLHFGRSPTPQSMERYKAVPPGGNRFDLLKNRPDITPNCWKRKKTGGTDLFGRLWWDRPSVTIRTEFFKPEKGRYLHPSQNRPITHREAARIQSFPDDFIFCGSKIEIARQIGNAVPPLLAQAIAEEVIACLKKETSLDYVAETSEGIKYLHKLNGVRG